MLPYILIYIIYLPAMIAKYANVLISIFPYELLALGNNRKPKDRQTYNKDLTSRKSQAKISFMSSNGFLQFCGNVSEDMLRMNQ